MPPRCQKTGFQSNLDPPPVPSRTKEIGASALVKNNEPEPFYENGRHFENNLICLNSPNPSMDQLCIEKTKSDPVSPNVPCHPELDRRHSDSLANISVENSSHTYQNTILVAGAKPKSHDQLQSSKKNRQ